MRHQRGDQAGTLVDGRRSFGAMAQAHGMGVACFGEPGHDRAQKDLGVVAAGQQRTGDVHVARTLKHPQHPLGAAELSDFPDQKVVQSGAAAQRVQAHAGIDQALERVSQVAGWRASRSGLRHATGTFAIGC